jgi:hypothetical protein
LDKLASGASFKDEKILLAFCFEVDPDFDRRCSDSHLLLSCFFARYVRAKAMDLPHGNSRVTVPEIASDLYRSSYRVKYSDKSPLRIVLPKGIYDPDTLCKSGSALPAIKVGGNQDESQWVSDHPSMRDL